MEARARRGLPAALLILAALADLPVVYRLIARSDVAPPVALGFGFLSMGLAWGAGFRIEGRRAWFVAATAAAGALQLAAPLMPGLPTDAFVPWCFISGGLSAIAFVAALPARATPR